MKTSGENKMFGLGRKKQEKNISSVEEALGIVKQVNESGTIERVVIKSDTEFSEEEKNNPELFIKHHFKPEESSYYCQGKYVMRKNKGQAKHSISLNYFNRIHTEVAPLNLGFASAGVGRGNNAGNYVHNTQTNSIRKATIEFYAR
jgi:hypothetical protein